jgi:hypothetical protein
MEQLYDIKKGTEILQDGVYLRITTKDLAHLKADLTQHQNDANTNFKVNMEFVKEAEDVINNLNMAVYYNCSW